ncbi:carbohydrate binding domain-containing protein [Gracilimonas mengyeensis]|uniref:Carbohydrate binding domain-containing protein n=1 Tax=Gracilimonas mengyeensis TaxID=1302730 RepID=A0A521FEU9_9BACT|nr:carbohydrate binding domain-containing protein [Gracilimonas mengyeensis]SMO94712.1 Carbohydrate binding domain-containing protein [Gracilimonas mengyeensis]
MICSKVLNTALFILLTSIFLSKTILAQEVLIPKNSNWKYSNDGSFPGAAWVDFNYDDSSWPAGPGILGFGDGIEQTTLNSGLQTKQMAKEGTFASTAITGENLLENGNFSNGMTGWDQYIQTTNAAASFSAGNGILHASIADGGDQGWHVQLHQRDLTIEYGATYEVSFDAWADGNRAMSMTVGMQSSPYDEFTNESIDLTTSSQTFAFEFTMEDPTIPKPDSILTWVHPTWMYISTI